MPKEKNKLINVTELSEYIYCPRKLYIKKTRKLREPFNKKMLIGWLRHTILDIFNKNESAFVSCIKETLTEKEILKLYENILRKIILAVLKQNESRLKSFKIEKIEILDLVIRGMQEELRIRTKAVFSTLKKGFLGKQLWRNLTPKYLTEYRIVSEELGIIGRIDRIIFDKEITPYEIKNNSSFFDSDKIQVAAYALLLEKEFHKPIKKAVIKTKSEKHEIIIDDIIKKRVLEIIKKIKNITSSVPPIQNNFNKCRSCAFREVCMKI